MRRQGLIFVLAFGLTGSTGCDIEDMFDHGRPNYTEDFHYSYPLHPGGRVSLENFNGSVEIAAWDDNSVEIDGTKYARTPELLQALKIDISASADSIAIRTVRPSDLRGNLGAKYVIKVPRKTELERIVSTNGPVRTEGVEGSARLKTTNGPVRALDLRGGLDVQTTNGPVAVQNHNGSVTVRTTNGPIRAEGVRGAFEGSTSNGPITAEIVKPDPARAIKLETSNGGIELRLQAPTDVRASTSNGGITLHLPENAGARLMASTSNSSIRSDFEVQSRGPASKHHLEGTIGAGGPLLDLSTTNGTIRLLRQ